MAISKEADDILRKARALIENPERWTQDASARDSEGVPVHPRDNAAACFCAMGALTRVSRPGTGAYFDAVCALSKASDVLFCASPAAVNDHLTHADVLKMFSAARWQ